MKTLILKILILSVSIVLGFTLKAQNTGGNQPMKFKKKQGYTVYFHKSGDRFRGWTIDSTERSIQIRTIKGEILTFNNSLIVRRKYRGHKKKPIVKDSIPRSISEGFFSSFTIGILPASISALRNPDDFDQQYFGLVYEPTWSFHHKTGYNFGNGRCVTLGMGMERFQRSLGDSYREDTEEPFFINLPVYLGIQKHFKPIGIRRKRGHAYFSGDYGSSINTQSYNEEQYSFFNSSTVSRNMHQFFQAHIGWQYFFTKKNAMIIELGFRHQKSKITERYVGNPENVSNLNYSYNRLSGRIGIAF